MKPWKESGLLSSIHSPSSVRYSSMLMNQQFLRLSRRSFTSRTKIGYCPTGPTGQMKTVRRPAALFFSISAIISSAIS